MNSSDIPTHSFYTIKQNQKSGIISIPIFCCRFPNCFSDSIPDLFCIFRSILITSILHLLAVYCSSTSTISPSLLRIPGNKEPGQKGFSPLRTSPTNPATVFLVSSLSTSFFSRIPSICVCPEGLAGAIF